MRYRIGIRRVELVETVIEYDADSYREAVEHVLENMNSKASIVFVKEDVRQATPYITKVSIATKKSDLKESLND